MSSNDEKTRSIVDNWLLQLACELLESGFGRVSMHPINMYYFVYGYEKNTTRDREQIDLMQFKRDRIIVQEKLMALFQLLYLLVINDELIYDEEKAFVWKSTKLLSPINSYLLPVKLSREKKEEISLKLSVQPHEEYSSLVSEKALYYLGLSKLLGVHYWPSPQRAKFIEQNLYSNLEVGFVMQLKDLIDNELSQAINEILSKIKVHEQKLEFAGFGEAILANCYSRQSILPTMVEFRESKSVKAFRSWLREMDVALAEGNIKHIAENLNDVNDVIFLFRKDLSLEKFGSTAELKIGISPSLSPSVNLDLKSIEGILKHFKPKKYHLVFLRNHFDRILNGYKITNVVQSLFQN